MLEYVACNLCGADDTEVLYRIKERTFRFVHPKPFLPDGNSILKRNERTIKTLVLKYHYRYSSELNPQNIIKKNILRGVSLPFKFNKNSA